MYDCADPVQRERGIGAAIGAIRRGELVVVPTDTVYGLAADAFAPRAVDALLATKGRGRDMPVPVLVSSAAMLDAVAGTLHPAGRSLAETFWPGALTLVTKHTPGLAWDLGDTRGTVAVRMPANDVAVDLIGETGPLAVSSANRSGSPPATTIGEAEEALGADVAVYLDGGACAAAVPSTIIDVTGEVPRLLRAGAIDLDAIREVVGDLDIGDLTAPGSPPPP